MNFLNYLIIIMGIGLIILHGFWPSLFKIDNYIILLYFILLLPSVAKYLKKAKLPGAEFEFREEIIEAKKLVNVSIEKTLEGKKDGETQRLQFETFKLLSVRELLPSDPVLALAALRIEIEKKLKLAIDFLGISTRREFSISNLIEALGRKDVLSLEQISALQKIVNMCNKAVHGVIVSKKEASEIINLVEELNKTFSIGYSIDFSVNQNYNKQGLLCEWEHCIEWFPLSEKVTEYSCPVFGHNCPGGTTKISKCGKTIKDIPGFL